ncbi:MAG: DUF1464 family protein [Candidatus Promineifilaceae bacterium]|jgi:predicted butyrate kinase (DUF1464 family)
MARVIGIDPGTVSFDLLGLDDGEVFMDMTIPSSELAADPQKLVDVLDSARPLDLVIGPSGYGLPWVTIEEFSSQDLFLFILADSRERDHISVLGGMADMIVRLKETDLPVVFMPAVIHLPTVPTHRKANKIDMGTADKLCCVALGVYDQARTHRISYSDTSFIFVEVGGAYTAVMAVQNGRVVDGLGGSVGGPGYYALGGMDGELAYLLGEFHKDVLFSGGVAFMTGQPAMQPEESLLLRAEDPLAAGAWEALFEGVVKSVAAELVAVPEPREILLSGRLCRSPIVQAELSNRLQKFAPVRRISGIADVAKEAAQGAAIIADGMAGGEFADLVETMRLRDVRGTVLDYLHVNQTEALKQKYLGETD